MKLKRVNKIIILAGLAFGMAATRWIVDMIGWAR